jgi:hypothetical protein
MKTSNAEQQQLRTAPRAWLESNVSLVARTVRAVAQRRRLRPHDAEELLSTMLTHLVTDDYCGRFAAPRPSRRS